MIEPAANAVDVAALRAVLFAVMAFPIVVAMAGGYPCCCNRTGSSTSTAPPTSTSTSLPPVPPLPPGSTSTAPPPPLPPRKRTSSVGPIQLTDCNCCTGGQVADQWQAEVTGVANDGFCAPGTELANGVYICDGGINQQTSTYYDSCATFDIWGCGCGGVDVPSQFCPSERLFAIWELYIAAVQGTIAGTAVDYMTYFHVAWRGIPPAFCGGHDVRFKHLWSTPSKTAFAPVQCDSIAPSALIDCNSVSGLVIAESSGFYGGQVELFLAEGF